MICLPPRDTSPHEAGLGSGETGILFMFSLRLTRRMPLLVDASLLVEASVLVEPPTRTRTHQPLKTRVCFLPVGLAGSGFILVTGRRVCTGRFNPLPVTTLSGLLALLLYW